MKREKNQYLIFSIHSKKFTQEDPKFKVPKTQYYIHKKSNFLEIPNNQLTKKSIILKNK
jgi:hypothetical protein